MDFQLEARNTVPQELGDVEKAIVNSFTEALQILESKQMRKKALKIVGPLELERRDMNSLVLMSKAFGLNRTIQMLEFDNLEVNHILIAKVFRVGLRNNKVTSIKFRNCKTVSNERIMGSMCKGLKQRSTAFQLQLDDCSQALMKPILETSYLKCFSLEISSQDCSKIERPLKNLFSRGSLYYITLRKLRGLKAEVFLLLGRSLLPNIASLNLSGTVVPSSALKRLIGSLKKVLDSGRSNLFESLCLGKTRMGSKLSFACSRLLQFGLVGQFALNVKKDVSRAVVKNISSNVANTKNLWYLAVGGGCEFSSGTSFTKFNLQKKQPFYGSPFGVNPTVA